VNLRDRCRTNRLGVELGKGLVERTFQRLFDRGADLLERRRRQRVLKAGQVLRSLLADQIGAGGERLAELDGGRADRLKAVA
jgi:hypothetical protein